MNAIESMHLAGIPTQRYESQEVESDIQGVAAHNIRLQVMLMLYTNTVHRSSHLYRHAQRTRPAAERNITSHYRTPGRHKYEAASTFTGKSQPHQQAFHQKNRHNVHERLLTAPSTVV